ncbi:MAG: hypothetical protein FWH05_07680 [Oscillospiraceae bacterium]|nr:hypothetical protein [Oscillospiraceae bacterium]
MADEQRHELPTRYERIPGYGLPPDKRGNPVRKDIIVPGIAGSTDIAGFDILPFNSGILGDMGFKN